MKDAIAGVGSGIQPPVYGNIETGTLPAEREQGFLRYCHGNNIYHLLTSVVQFHGAITSGIDWLEENISLLTGYQWHGTRDRCAPGLDCGINALAENWL